METREALAKANRLINPYFDIKDIIAQNRVVRTCKDEERTLIRKYSSKDSKMLDLWLKEMVRHAIRYGTELTDILGEGKIGDAPGKTFDMREGAADELMEDANKFYEDKIRKFATDAERIMPAMNLELKKQKASGEIWFRYAKLSTSAFIGTITTQIFNEITHLWQKAEASHAEPLAAAVLASIFVGAYSVIAIAREKAQERFRNSMRSGKDDEDELEG